MWNQTHKLPPGSRAPESGQYQIIDSSGEKRGTRTATAGTRLPPTPRPGMTYVFIESRAIDDVVYMRRGPVDETDYLLASRENVRFLRRSMAEAAAGKVITVDPRDLGITE